MRFKLIILLVILCCSEQLLAENEDVSEVERLCYPDMHKNTRKSCECISDSAPPWGLRVVKIDCSFKRLKSNEFSESLPVYVDSLDISWNELSYVPSFSSDSLHLLNLMHNNITQVNSKNFIKISNLQELYLAWNSIQFIQSDAFNDLAHLSVLDLSHNNLHALSPKIFAQLLVLETLNLSWNRQLNETTDIEQNDFFETFGVNTKLHALKLEACGLSNITLNKQADLLELNLRHNRLASIPINLPTKLQKLDLSNNLMETLTPIDNKTLSLLHLKTLYFEDMPNLESIEADFFTPFVSLHEASFQNSRSLSSVDAYAFGHNNSASLPIRSLIFRGTFLRSLNATLLPVFNQLERLDLNGVPLSCDCELSWMLQVKLESFGRCFNPSRLRGLRISSVRAKDFSCSHWPVWLYSSIILGLILIIAVGIYLVVMGLRPTRGVTMRSKVGAGSPYARVTIEPNRQENWN